MDDIVTTLKTTRQLVDLLCQRGEHNAARDVVEAVAHLFHADDQGWLQDAVAESEDRETQQVRLAALKLLGVKYTGPLPKGLNLSPADVRSAERAGWRVVVEPEIEPAVRATNASEDDPLGQGTWAVYRDGRWGLCRVDDVGESRDVGAPFTTLRAAIAFAISSREIS
jgi:hypothetical protein